MMSASVIADLPCIVVPWGVDWDRVIRDSEAGVTFAICNDPDREPEAVLLPFELLEVFS